ncbi:MAG TPA: helix-turn-helix domain-containing protein [Candidatus Eisenbacteria bacterium]|jgi:CRP-like cAMP-binding protein|nr:helix-turn-helix domain-containing protein [Candidatus Eisenbacteria bacterium]
MHRARYGVQHLSDCPRANVHIGHAWEGHADAERGFCVRDAVHELTRNRRIEQNLIDHMLHFSEKRLARTLISLAQSRNNGQMASMLENIGQDTLADMIGTTRSRVNFFMNKFRKSGYIHYSYGLKVYDSLASILQD